MADNYFLVEELEENVNSLTKEDMIMADLKTFVDQHFGNMETIEASSDQSTTPTQNIQNAIFLENVDINTPTTFVLPENQANNVEAIEGGGNEQNGSNRQRAAIELLDCVTSASVQKLQLV